MIKHCTSVPPKQTTYINLMLENVWSRLNRIIEMRERIVTGASVRVCECRFRSALCVVTLLKRGQLNHNVTTTTECQSR